MKIAWVMFEFTAISEVLKTYNELQLISETSKEKKYFCTGCGGGQKLEPMLFCTLCDLGTFRTNQSKIDKCIHCGENLTTFENGSVSQDQCVGTSKVFYHSYRKMKV